jgi:transcriptional regulator with GAF, ATPase, and Fis domain
LDGGLVAPLLDGWAQMSVGLASQRVDVAMRSTDLSDSVVELAIELARLEPEQIEARLAEILATLGEQTGADSVTLLRFGEPGSRTPVSFQGRGFARYDDRVVPGAEVLALLPATMARLQRGESVSVASLDALPVELADERGVYERCAVEAMFAEPLCVGRTCVGALVLTWLQESGACATPDVLGLRAMAALFAGALARRASPQAAKSAPTREGEVAVGMGTLAEVDRAHILAVLRACHWVVAGPHGAAARLGMKRSTLNFRMQKLGIVRERG